MLDKEFSYPVRVYLEDTDAGGIVYYINYLKYFERARTECLRIAGFDFNGLAETGMLFVVHSANVRYLRSAKMDDALDVTVRITKIGRTFVLFEQAVKKESVIMCEGEIKVACVSISKNKPCAMPAALRSSFREFEN